MKSTQVGSLLHGVLRLVQASGGKVNNRISIQKSAYLLQALGVSDFASADFTYHHYGPYSRQLSDALQEAVGAGLLAESRDDFAQGYLRYSYRLTEDGQKWLKEEFDARPDATEKHAGVLSGTHWRALELAATVVFLEREGIANDRAEAVATALRFKPECKNSRDKAEQLLTHLGLVQASRR
jgi:uncharacterized protein YwgA